MGSRRLTMHAVRTIIDADRLSGIVKLPRSFVKKRLEITVIPFEDITQEAVFDTQDNEYRTKNGFLVREGVVIPKGDENDPSYSAENLRHIAGTGKSMAGLEREKTFTEQEWNDYVSALEELQ
jgi:hypothetical protein